MIFQDKIGALRDRFERLSQRERTMVSALGVAVAVMLTLIVGFLITEGLSNLEERNGAMRQALKDMESHRGSYLLQRSKSAQLETRLGHGAVHLGSYLEQAAKDSGIQIPESNELPSAPAGKQWVQRSVTLQLQHVKLDQLASFMKRIETGPNLVLVTSLNIRTRDDKHIDLDVEMTVSTWERSKPTGKETGKKGEKT
jgi:hypothetical protein